MGRHTVLGDKLLDERGQSGINKVLNNTDPLLGTLLDPSSHVHLQHCQYLPTLLLVALGNSLRSE